MRSRWPWLGGAAVLGVVVWWSGTDPFVAGIRALDPATLVAGAALGVVTTVASAWRWRLVAGGLGVAVPLGRATAACYRSQLLNSVLPGGVLGDLHRGVDHGRATGDAARGLRAVVWERTAGQAVQAGLAVLVLALLPSPVRSSLPALLAVGVLVLVVLGALVLTTRTLRADAAGLLEHRVWPGVVLASTVAVAGYLATFVLAARAVGVEAPVTTLAPLVLLVLVAAGLPTNLVGWGPREGMAAFAFALAGLGAGQGVAAAVAYGVIVLVACLPGVVVLLVGVPGRRLRRPAGVPAVAGRVHD